MHAGVFTPPFLLDRQSVKGWRRHSDAKVMFARVYGNGLALWLNNNGLQIAGPTGSESCYLRTLQIGKPFEPNDLLKRCKHPWTGAL